MEGGKRSREGQDEEGLHEDGHERRKRGPYKQYLIQGSNRPVPESTLRSRRKAEARRELGRGNQVPPVEVDDVQEHSLSCNTDTIEEAANSVDNASIHDVLLNPNQASADDVRRKQKVDYVKKYNLNGRLHRDFSISKLDALLMILHLSVRHCHTQPFVEDMISFINTLFEEVVLDISYHIYSSLFPSSQSIVKHYFCPDCEVSLGSESELIGMKEKVCGSCEKPVSVNSKGNFFISIDLREQIRTILERPDCQLVDRDTREGNAVTDIFDGSLYKKCRAVKIPISRLLTATVNTDGVRVHESTKNTMYPIPCHLNEIVPEQRFKPDNVLLAGLWFARSAPSMSLFLKPFTDQMLDLAENGVTCEKPDGSKVTYHVFPVACSVDSVAKPKIVCQKQFNGRCGCLYCLHPNDTTIDGFPANQRFYDTSVVYPLRTEEQVIADMYSADEKERQGSLKNDSVNGFLGLSVLLEFTRLLGLFSVNTFHIVWGMVVDYMHNALEGVTADLIDLYLSVLSSDQIAILNERISEITPPQAMTRRPRPLSEKMHWKAKEYRSFLLYYAIPCLKDLLPQRHFALLKQFVNAMHILLSDNITNRAFSEAKSALSLFVSGFQRLYGLHKVTYNLHLLTHLCDLVLRLGPLWCYSNFVFESCNGRLVKLIRGTKSIIMEIANKFTKLQIVPKIIVENPISVTALEFCNSVSGFRYVKNGEEVDGVFLTGSYSIVNVSEAECDLLTKSSIAVNDLTATFYNRAVRKGIVFCSKSYSKSKVYDDSCVMLDNGQYAVIDKIFKTETEELVCLMIPIRVAEVIIPSIRECSRHCFSDPTIVPFKNISQKCVLVSYDDKNFICNIPNFYERD